MFLIRFKRKNIIYDSITIPQNGMSIVTAINNDEIIQNVIKKHFPIYIVGIVSVYSFLVSLPIWLF